MSELLNSGRFGKNDTPKDVIINNWTHTGLLDGIGSDMVLEKTALTLEDGAKILLQLSDYINYNRFDVAAFPIIRRVISDIDKSRYPYAIGRDKNYEEHREALIDMIDADFIIKKGLKMYPKTVIFFSELYSDENIDVEAEACAFIAERITKLYLNQFKNVNIIKTDNGYTTVSKPLPEGEVY